jgi:hypothetical protein
MLLIRFRYIKARYYSKNQRYIETISNENSTNDKRFESHLNLILEGESEAQIAFKNIKKLLKS